MEISVTNVPVLISEDAKHEQDESIKANPKSESGIFSEESLSSDKSSWEMLEGEVCDNRIFDPPLPCSSNVWIDPLNLCEISSIFELTPPVKCKLQKLWCIINEYY